MINKFINAAVCVDQQYGVGSQNMLMTDDAVSYFRNTAVVETVAEINIVN